ncbi:MAG: CDP-glycerol glycerophosphotransferase family protein [Ruminococcus sp.]|nr:CDP-glycerol glycerophosphotransferase family protein [Ruminococcus sp.]
MSIKSIIKNTAKFAAFKIIYPAVYGISRLRRVDKNKIIFAEIRGDKLSDNFRLIYERLKEVPELELTVFFARNNSGGFGYLWRYAKLAAMTGNARCVLLNETCNLFGAFRLRKETKLIQTWHACGAFKRWGKSCSDKSFGETAEAQDKFPAHTNYTLVTVSSPECIPAYKEAFGLSSKSSCVQAVGVSRTDYYFMPDSRERAFGHIYKICPAARGKKIILYAPTFRGEADKAYIPNMLDIPSLKESFGEDHVLLIKRHGFVRKRYDIPDECRDFAFDVTEDTGIEKLIITADICITDYSSLIFEFSLMERPMIFFAFDLEEYYDSRGFFYSYDESFLPGKTAKTGGELTELIKEAESSDCREVKAFRKRFMSACDGRSTERIVKRILSAD